MSDTGTTFNGDTPQGGGFGAKKVGPFTPQVWVMIIVAGALLGYVIRKRTGTVSTAAATAVDPATADETNPANYGYQATGGPYAGAGSTDTGTTTASGAPTTNLQWSNQAIQQLIALGNDPADAATAVGNYLDGIPVTPQQNALISLAIRYVGSPPEGAPPPQLIPTTVAAAATTNPAAPVSVPITTVDTTAPPTNSQPPPTGSTLTPVQQQWVGNVITVRGRLNAGDQTAFPQAQFLNIAANDPALNLWAAIAYAGYLNQHGGQNLVHAYTG